MTNPRVEAIIDEIIRKEGGYVNDRSDLGGETMYGITVAVARENDYTGDMRDLPLDLARTIYLNQYFYGPHFDRVARHSWPIAEELTDTGVNMGQTDAVAFLQQSLNAFNDQSRLYPDLKVDGYIGDKTIAAVRAFLEHRGAEGEQVMLVTLNCLQAADYIRLSVIRPKNERFTYGWIANRVQLKPA